MVSALWRLTTEECATRVGKNKHIPLQQLVLFYFSGRSVSLEHWIKGKDGGAGSSASGSSVRVITHMISCRGSDIFLHALGVSRCPFEDPPDITNMISGKLSDYRINVRLMLLIAIYIYDCTTILLGKVFAG